jgi:hypothetical protein
LCCRGAEYTELFVVPHANGNVSLQSRVWGDGRYGTSDWNVGTCVRRARARVLRCVELSLDSHRLGWVGLVQV